MKAGREKDKDILVILQLSCGLGSLPSSSRKGVRVRLARYLARYLFFELMGIGEENRNYR